MSRNSLLFIVLLMVGLVTVMYLAGPGAEKQQLARVGVAEIVRLAEEGNIERANVEGKVVHAWGKNGMVYTAYTNEPHVATKTFRERRIPYRESPQQIPVGEIIGSLLWPVLLILLFFLLMRGMAKRQQGTQMSFGNHKAKLIHEEKTKTTFADIAGIDEAIEDSKDIVDYLKRPKDFTSVGAHIPKGVLLVGDPGCGKTLLAKALAGEAGVPFFSVSGSSFVEMFVGVGAARVRNLFEAAEKHAPCIVFIDEIDAVGKKRAGATFGGGHDEREQTLNELLVAMDGFSSTAGVIVIAATNQPDILDEALTRKGRFDRSVVVPRPDLRGRVDILKIHLRTKVMDPDVDILALAKGCPGMSGADLESVVNEAVLAMAKAKRKTVTQEDLMRARDRTQLGPERRSMVQTQQALTATAYHEGGHALVGWLTAHASPVHRVSIVPRGRALGATWSAPDEDTHSQSQEHLLALIRTFMGGRAAEELIYGKNGVTTGIYDDMKRATRIAEVMVERLGMSEVGLRTIGPEEGAPAYLPQQSRSPHMAARVDDAIEKILQTQYDAAFNLLKEHKASLEAIKDLLLEKETIDHTDLTLIAGAKVVPKALLVPG